MIFYTANKNKNHPKSMSQNITSIIIQDYLYLFALASLNPKNYQTQHSHVDNLHK